MSFSRAGILVIALWMLGKLLAFGKDLLVSFYFGASDQTDAYFIASNIPTLIYAGLLATVPLVLLPLYTKKVSSEGSASADLLASGVLNWYSVLTVIMTLVVFVFADGLVQLIAPTASASTLSLAVVLTRIFSLTFVFSMVSAVLTTIQLAGRQVVGVQIIPIFNNAVFIAGVLIFSMRFGIFAAAWAATVAWLIQLPIQLAFVRNHYKYSYVWKLSRTDKAALSLVFFPALISVSIDQLNPIVSIYFASGLPEGSISMLSYVSRMISLCTGVFIVIVSTITYPELAHKLSENKVAGFIEDVYWSTKMTLFLSVLMSMVFVFLSKEIVMVVFERGLFSSNQTVATAGILSISAMSIPFIALREIYARGVYAFGKARLAMLTGLVVLVTNAMASYLLVPIFGIAALATALVISTAAGCIVGFVVLHRVLRRWPDRSLYVFLIRLATIAAITSLCLGAFLELLPLHAGMLRLVAGCCLALALFLGLSLLTGIVGFDFSSGKILGQLARRSVDVDSVK